MYKANKDAKKHKIAVMYMFGKKMRINKETQKYISIAEKPGTFGIEFHNQGYELLGLNAIYLPLKVSPPELRSVMQLVRGNFQGCSVSMPHKIAVIDYLDGLDESALKTGSVNTILNENGRLTGYNTDFYGAKTAIQRTFDIKGRRVLMIGAGGVAMAIGPAVQELGGRLTITNRTQPKAKSLAEKLGSEIIDFEARTQSRDYYLLINATRVGFDNPDESIVPKSAIADFDAVMDVVIPITELLEEAKRQGKIIIPGALMTAYQAARQFEIYTGKKLPEEFISEVLERLKK